MGLGPIQREWLRRTLKDAASKDQKAVLFSHVGAHRDQMNRRHPYYRLSDEEEVRRILEESGCAVAYLSGHAHNPGHCVENGVHYVTIQGMVEAPLYVNGYAVVEVYPDRLEVRGVGLQPNITLNLPAGVPAGAAAPLLLHLFGPRRAVAFQRPASSSSSSSVVPGSRQRSRER